MVRFILITLSLFLVSCSSIPLGTMLQLSTFNENSFLSLNPEELKTKILVDMPAKIAVSKTKISLTLKTEKGDLAFNYPLTLISTKNLPKENGFFSSIPQRTEYLLVLSNEAIEDFRKVQNEMRTKSPKSVSFNVNFDFEEFPTKLAEVTFSIFLKLSKEDDFITLFDRGSLKVNYSGQKNE